VTPTKLRQYIYNGLINTKEWWFEAAHRCMQQGHFKFITGRKDDDVYLARFWLSQPVTIGEDKFESGNSVLLHYFPRGDDDDESLHTHPWEFRTQVLSGGYVEILPDPKVWSGGLGPHIERQCDRIQRNVGDVMYKSLDSIHMVDEVDQDTWTLVTTGARHQDWYFWPAGKEFLGYGD